MTRQLILSDPKVMMGQPVIAGTRITVELILEKLAAGETIEQLLEAHPRLTREAIQAALGAKNYPEKRSKRASQTKFDKAMKKVAKVEPPENDRL